MRNKKVMLLMSFTLAAFLVIGGTVFASEGIAGMGMMNGMMNANGDGMMNMMNGNGMSNMMEAIKSPEGKEMVESCQNGLSSYGE